MPTEPAIIGPRNLEEALELLKSTFVEGAPIAQAKVNLRRIKSWTTTEQMHLLALT